MAFVYIYFFTIALLWSMGSVDCDSLFNNRKAIAEYRDEILPTANQYYPQHIRPEHCRYMTPAQCQHEDEIVAQAKLKKKRSSSGTTDKHRQLNNINSGSIRALIVLVRFTDHVDRPLPSREHFDALCNDDLTSNSSSSNKIYNLGSGGPIKRYMELASYGQYKVECVVTDWITTRNTEAFYTDGVRGMRGALLSAQFFEPALDELDESGLDWNLYDQNDDGNLDAVIVIHSGYPSEAGGGSECNDNAPENRFRSFGYSASPENSWSSSTTNVRLDGYAIGSAFDGVCDLSNYARMGVLTHEWLHTFGALDLYDLSTGWIGGVGSFDIMANPFGTQGDPSLPGSMSPFSRELVGWVEPMEIVKDGVYVIRASNRYPDAYIIKRGYPEGEYLLIENRQPVDFDGDLFGNGGLLIYHVDNAKRLQEDRGYPGQDGWPQNGNHYRVAVLQADGQYDLEKGVNNGDFGDIWTQGMTLGPGNGVNFPNTDAYQFGQIVPTGILISDISASGMNMTFRVSGIAPLEDTAEPTESPVSSTAASEAPPLLTEEPTMSPVSAPTGMPTTSGSLSGLSCRQWMFTGSLLAASFLSLSALL